VVSPQVSRGFVAVVPPDDVLDAAESVLDGVTLPAGARRTDRSKLHLTVRFLGDQVRFERTEALLRDLDLRGGEARLGGAGAFPRARRGDVLWIGLAEGAGLLADLHAAVDAAHDPHRPADGRPPRFHPHLTVVRCRTPVDLRPAVAAIGPGPIGRTWPVEEVVLVHSNLGGGPAVYEERARIPLCR
jgi:2'-5' RNA ligase